MRLLLLIAWCALLWTLESASRRRPVLPNLALTAIVVAMNLALSTLVATVSAARSVGALEVVVGIVALDLSAYVAHVLLHKSALAWRFHRVHHSDEQVDVTTAFRQHPGETLWRVAWQLPAILILQLPFGVVVLYLTLSSLNAQLEHADVSLPAERWLRILFVTPGMHKVHHSCVQQETDSNYANLFSVWDRLFRTYNVPRGSLRYGLDDVPDPRTIRALLARPLR